MPLEKRREEKERRKPRTCSLEHYPRTSGNHGRKAMEVWAAKVTDVRIFGMQMRNGT